MHGGEEDVWKSELSSEFFGLEDVVAGGGAGPRLVVTKYGPTVATPAERDLLLASTARRPIGGSPTCPWNHAGAEQCCGFGARTYSTITL